MIVLNDFVILVLVIIAGIITGNWILNALARFYGWRPYDDDR